MRLSLHKNIVERKEKSLVMQKAAFLKDVLGPLSAGSVCYLQLWTLQHILVSSFSEHR